MRGIAIIVGLFGWHAGETCDEPSGRAIQVEVMFAPTTCAVDVPTELLTVAYDDTGLMCPAGCTCAPACRPQDLSGPITGAFAIECDLASGHLSLACDWMIDQWESGYRESLSCDATVLDATGAERCSGTGSRYCDDTIASSCPGF
jgi:hypothetical protein